MAESSEPSLVASFFESWSVYLGNVPLVGSYHFRMMFAGLGALFTGRLFQIALATTDFFLRLKMKDSWPSRNFDRYLALTNAHLGVETKDSILHLVNYLLLASLGIGIVVIGAPLGLMVGTLLGMFKSYAGILQGVGFLSPIIVGGALYVYCIAVLHLEAGVAVKLGTADPKNRQEEADAMLKQHVIPFAVYMLFALLGSWAGVILCCVGIVLTMPYVVVAGYVGMINLFGITPADVESFLAQEAEIVE